MNKHKVVIRLMMHEDWQQVAEIYKEGINSGNATFQQHVPTCEEWDADHVKSSRQIAQVIDKIAGWAALSAVSKRIVYSGVAEVSIYISSGFRGYGIGTELLQQLITVSGVDGFWTLQAGIFPENQASLQIHKKLGFRQIGYRERIGEMNGMWRDTILLERRSSVIGINFKSR
jgi:L-amino acid N-acyltransferase YncA